MLTSKLLHDLLDYAEDNLALVKHAMAEKRRLGELSRPGQRDVHDYDEDEEGEGMMDVEAAKIAALAGMQLLTTAPPPHRYQDRRLGRHRASSPWRADTRRRGRHPRRAAPIGSKRVVPRRRERRLERPRRRGPRRRLRRAGGAHVGGARVSSHVL